jgi:hypothetical protein
MNYDWIYLCYNNQPEPVRIFNQLKADITGRRRRRERQRQRQNRQHIDGGHNWKEKKRQRG